MNLTAYFYNNLVGKVIGIIFMSAMVSACGKSTTLSPELLNGESIESVENSPEIQEVSQDVVEAEAQIQDVENEILKLNSIAPAKIKLTNLKDIIKKFKNYRDLLVQKIEVLDAKIQDQINNLDPSIPDQKKIIDRLKKAQSSLNELKQKLLSIESIIKDLLMGFFEKLEEKLDQYQGSPFVSLVLKMLLQFLEDKIIAILV